MRLTKTGKEIIMENRKDIFKGVHKVVIHGQAESTIFTLRDDGSWDSVYCDSFGNCDDMGAVSLKVVDKELKTFMKIYRRNLEISGKNDKKVIAIYE